MSESGFHKCACKHCQQHIEFPAEAAGSEIACPHCGKQTLLILPRVVAAKPAEKPLTTPEPVASAWDEEAFPEKTIRCRSCGVKVTPKEKNCPNCGASIKKRTGLMVFRAIGVLAILSLGVVLLVAKLPKKGRGGSSGGGGKAGPDLIVYPHTVQKEAGGNLTYVVGSLANNSDSRYLAVKVEFELLSASGASLGTTSDYVPFLEPHRTWSYKAMVVDPDAVSAKLLSMTATRYVEDPKMAEERMAEEKKKADEAKAKKDKKK